MTTHKDHPLNKNKALCGFYAGVPVLFRARSQRQEDGSTHIVFEAIPIVSYTPHGVRIAHQCAWLRVQPKGRYVNLRAKKQWASTTMVEAVEQLRHRKRQQIRILNARLADAEEALYLIDNPPTDQV